MSKYIKEKIKGNDWESVFSSNDLSYDSEKMREPLYYIQVGRALFIYLDKNSYEIEVDTFTDNRQQLLQEITEALPKEKIQTYKYCKLHDGTTSANTLYNCLRRQKGNNCNWEVSPDEAKYYNQALNEIKQIINKMK